MEHGLIEYIHFITLFFDYFTTSNTFLYHFIFYFVGGHIGNKHYISICKMISKYNNSIYEFPLLKKNGVLIFQTPGNNILYFLISKFWLKHTRFSYLMITMLIFYISKNAYIVKRCVLRVYNYVVRPHPTDIYFMTIIRL